MASTDMKSITPQSLITEANLKKVLKSDKGPDAQLKSFKVVDFTKPGDNYACVVTSVEVKYLKDKQDCNVTYVVKLNSLRNMGEFGELTPVFFEKEGKFYQEVVPALNEELISAGHSPLRLPKCFHVCLEEGKEQIYFEDLRVQGFKMYDRRKGMDKDHTALVMTELARLHSASHLLMSKLEGEETVVTRYEYLAKNWMNMCPKSKDMFLPAMNKQIDTGIKMLEKVGRYETSINWLNSLRPEIETILTSFLKSEKFNSICHGDCWNNNMLFRYDDDGHPVEVRLLDLQISQEASVAFDLNYFLFSSLSGEVRKPNLDQFMFIYHSTYKDVLDGGNLPMPFDKEELIKEYRDKNTFGVLLSIGFIAILLTEPDEALDLTDTDIDTLMKEWQAQALEKLGTNPLCKPRFLSAFDELIENGLIS